MVRSLFSGVSGMRAHQTRMDVIGNNIANVNTYGFKSSRTTFRDIYYQSVRNASGASGDRGGTNPSGVGYGAGVASVDVLQTQSIMQSTGNGLDVAITGEGFLQVMDSAGNVFYTKAGMLDIDAQGNLVDLNGNFVLGVSGNPVGKAPGSDVIQIKIPSVNPAHSVAELSLNNRKITLESSKNSKDGNVNITFVSKDIGIGNKVDAVVSSSSISIVLNSKEEFTTAELEAEINAAIKEANGGKEHPGGTFSLKIEPALGTTDKLTGEQWAGADFGTEAGKAVFDAGQTGLTNAGFGFANNGKTGLGFSANGPVTYKVKRVAKADLTVGVDDAEIAKFPAGSEYRYDFEVYAGNPPAAGATPIYKQGVYDTQADGAGEVVLTSTAANPAVGDNLTMTFPSAATMNTYFQGIPAGGAMEFTATGTVTPAQPSKDMGLGANPITLKGGTAGGEQSVKDLSGIAIGPDGVITATHAILGKLEVGRIDLATFENAKGLQQTGNTYFSATSNSGEANVEQPGESGAGNLKASNLEMSNVDLSNEFSDMIVTQRGFQANSRIITVSDTMLEELINLKR